MEALYFDLAGQGQFKGYDRVGLRWNGWKCPLFPIETVRQIAALTKEWLKEYPDGIEYVRIDEDGRVFMGGYEDGEVEIKPEATEAGDLYDIGSFGWCWDLCYPQPSG